VNPLVTEETEEEGDHSDNDDSDSVGDVVVGDDSESLSSSNRVDR